MDTDPLLPTSEGRCLRATRFALSPGWTGIFPLRENVQASGKDCDSKAKASSLCDKTNVFHLVDKLRPEFLSSYRKQMTSRRATGSGGVVARFSMWLVLFSERFGFMSTWGLAQARLCRTRVRGGSRGPGMARHRARGPRSLCWQHPLPWLPQPQGSRRGGLSLTNPKSILCPLTESAAARRPCPPGTTGLLPSPARPLKAGRVLGVGAQAKATNTQKKMIMGVFKTCPFLPSPGQYLQSRHANRQTFFSGLNGLVSQALPALESLPRAGLGV